MVVVYTPKRRTASVDLHIGGAVVTFRLTSLEETGESVMLAEVSDPAVVSACKRMGYRVLDDAPPQIPAPAAVKVAERAERTTPEGWRYPAIVQTAFGNGWVYEDLTGAGDNNQWGIEGGRGRRSGLTMAELSLTIPPQDWEAKSATHWPWEILGWKAPGDGWKAPVLPSKRRAADEVPPVDEAPVPLAPAAEDPEAEEEPVDDGALLGGHQDDPAPVEPAPEPEPAPETRNAELLADFSKDQVNTAIETLKSVWTQAGKPPSPSKARHYLAKAGIQPVTTEQVQALLDLVQTTI